MHAVTFCAAGTLDFRPEDCISTVHIKDTHFVLGGAECERDGASYHVSVAEGGTHLQDYAIVLNLVATVPVSTADAEETNGTLWGRGVICNGMGRWRDGEMALRSWSELPGKKERYNGLK